MKIINIITRSAAICLIVIIIIKSYGPDNKKLPINYTFNTNAEQLKRYITETVLAKQQTLQMNQHSDDYSLYMRTPAHTIIYTFTIQSLKPGKTQLVLTAIDSITQRNELAEFEKHLVEVVDTRVRISNLY